MGWDVCCYEGVTGKNLNRTRFVEVGSYAMPIPGVSYPTMSRELRIDTAITRRIKWAALFLVAAMVFCFGILAWILLIGGGNEPANLAESHLMFAGILGVILASVYAFVTFARLQWRYRCPQCGARLPRVPASYGYGAQIRYECASCNVEWDTGMTVASAGG